jgi:hypothetical protein
MTEDGVNVESPDEPGDSVRDEVSDEVPNALTNQVED